MEDGLAHMHIAGICIFEGPSPSIAEVRSLVASKLDLVPRYRQYVRTVPFELGRPVWADDPNFDMTNHISRIGLGGAAGNEELELLMGRLMSQPLDRERPLWQTWLVDGLADGRWALIIKIHHCIVDGIAGVELLEVLLDVDRDAVIGAVPPWKPTPAPKAVAKVLDAWGGLAGDLLSWVGKVPRMITDPIGTVRGLQDTGRGLAGFVKNLTVPPALSIEGRVGADRTYASATCSLDDVKAIRAAHGGTVNDVVLAAVSGGFRELLSSRGEDPNSAVVRTAIPVSVRGADGHGVTDNRVSTLLYELPVGIADPVQRLAMIHDEVAAAKGSHMAEVGEAFTTIGDLAPPMLVGALSRLAMRIEHRTAQRVVHTIITNVPGPQFPLYCLGREMVESRPFVLITHGIRIAIAVLSYNGKLCFGATGDRDTAPDVAILAEGAIATISELYAGVEAPIDLRTSAEAVTPS